MSMMVKFAMAGFTKGNTVFKAMSEVHCQERINRDNMMDFNFLATTTNLAFIFISLQALFLYCCPKIAVSSFSTPYPSKMPFPDHVRPFPVEPIADRIRTLPSHATIIPAKYLLLGFIRLELLTTLFTKLGNSSTTLRHWLALHTSRISNTLALAGAIPLPKMIRLKWHLTLLAHKAIEFWHRFIIADLALIVKKYPDAPVLDKEDILVFRS